MSENRIPKKILENSIEGKRDRGKPKRWKGLNRSKGLILVTDNNEIILIAHRIILGDIVRWHTK